MSAIIIPSKNIYKIDNQKVVKNKINQVNYSYDEMNSATKEISFTYDIWNEENGINPNLTTISSGLNLFIETEIVVEDFMVDNVGFYLFYPNTEWTDRNGETHYGISYRQESIYYKEIDRKLNDNDDLLLSGDLRFLVYKETVSRYKTILTCYIYAGITGGTFKGYHTSASVYVSYNTIERKEVSENNNGQFALPKNEWMQYQTIAQSSDGNFHIYEYHSSKIISQYKNGKETATVLCSISDYYDENGEKVISERGGTINQKFSMYDVVVPMKYSKIGEEIPISRYQNGKRKEFYVVGIKLIYDGAVWQELTLQEKTQRV